MPKLTAIKFKEKGKVFYLETNNMNFRVDDKIVVSTSRGRELATVVKPEIKANESNAQADRELTFERKAHDKDIMKNEELQSKRQEVLNDANEIVKSLKMNIKLVDAEFTLDGNKVIISFMCDDRVDFRDLVKELAQKLKLKIELKQIGSRDHAKLVGGIGPCGQVCCCIRYLSEFDKVSVKMAKQQSLSLNPVKISGICGRLMCCLSYENQQYIEISATMPSLNSIVKTPSGDGVVIFNNIIKEKTTVKVVNGDDFKILEFKLSELEFNRDDTMRKKPCAAKNDSSDQDSTTDELITEENLSYDE